MKIRRIFNVFILPTLLMLESVFRLSPSRTGCPAPLRASHGYLALVVRDRDRTPSFLNTERQANKQRIAFSVFGLTRPGFELHTSQTQRGSSNLTNMDNHLLNTYNLWCYDPTSRQIVRFLKSESKSNVCSTSQSV